MKHHIRSHFAIRHTRMLLIKIGLSEEEADAFLDRLSEEFSEGLIDDERTRFAFIEREIAQLAKNERSKTTNVARMRDAICAIVLGAAGSALWDLLKAEFGNRQPVDSAKCPESWSGNLLIECAVPETLEGWHKGEALFRRALELRERRYGTLDMRTAISADSLGMCLDEQGRHREAEKMRRKALWIAEKVGGPVHASTGAALSNHNM